MSEQWRMTVLAMASIWMGACSTGVPVPQNKIAGATAHGACIELPVPCGGLLEGVWELESTCTSSLDDCNLTVLTPNLPGSRWTFDAASARFDWNMKQTYIEEYSHSCVSPNECIPGRDGWDQCSNQGDLCHCESTDYQSSDEWSYETSGVKLSFSDGEDGLYFDYCVDGDLLYLVTRYDGAMRFKRVVP